MQYQVSVPRSYTVGNFLSFSILVELLNSSTVSTKSFFVWINLQMKSTYSDLLGNQGNPNKLGLRSEEWSLDWALRDLDM